MKMKFVLELDIDPTDLREEVGAEANADERRDHVRQECEDILEGNLTYATVVMVRDPNTLKRLRTETPVPKTDPPTGGAS